MTETKDSNVGKLSPILRSVHLALCGQMIWNIYAGVKSYPYKHERSLWVIWWPGVLLTRRWFNVSGLRNRVGNSRYCGKTARAFFGPRRGTYMVFSLSLPLLVPSCLTPPHLGVKPLQSFQKSWEQVLLLVTALSLWNQLIILPLFVACLLGL